MKLPYTERYLALGIKMRKLLHRGYSGFFSYTPPVYDYTTVYDLDEAIELNHNGWEFDDYVFTHGNLALNLWRDLKNLEVENE